MSKYSVRAVLLMLAVAVPVGALATSFTADQVVLDKNNAVTSTGKMYSNGEMFRMEMASPQGEGTMVMVFRKDLHKHWIMLPDQKKYCEKPFDADEFQRVFRVSVEAENETLLGEETVSGYVCTKKEVVSTVKVMGFKRKSATTVWLSDKLGMAVRTRDSGGAGSELRNIKEGKVDAALFEVPKGYEKVGNMFALFASMGGPGPASSAEGEEAPPSAGELLKKSLGKGLQLPFGR